MKSSAKLAAACLALLSVPLVPAAAKVTLPVESALNVPLGCQIQQMKVLAVTNTSGGAISAGTRINYSYQRYPDHAERTGYLAGGTIAAGQVIKRGIEPAYSCKAWFRRAPVMAQ